MWPLILLAIGGGGYYYYKKQNPSAPLGSSQLHTDIMNLPLAGKPPAVIYSSPVIQTSNGPTSPIQSPGPTSVNPLPPIVHHDPVDLSTQHVDIMTAPTYVGPGNDTANTQHVDIMSAPAYVAPGYKLPNPDTNTIRDNQGGVWSFDGDGQIVIDPTSGTWITGTNFNVTTPTGSVIKMGPGWLININTAEIRY